MQRTRSGLLAVYQRTRRFQRFLLNISREILQQSRELEKIAENVEKKIVGRLKDMLKNDREKYKEFWEA